MDLTSLSSFLHSSKGNMDTGINKTLGDIHVVLCNESADLDSIVSCIVTGYHIAHSIYKEEKENKSEEQQSFVFSVINCSREELPLRTEAVYFLKDNGIRLDHLICRDEIDLAAIQGSGKLKLTLVDHNVLAHTDTHLAPSVCRVIDHHKREKPLDRRDMIEPVGSCCTLVAEIVWSLLSNDPVVCRLLYGTIVLDTVNFQASAQRTTPKDIMIAQELEEALVSLTGKPPSSTEIFRALTQARADVSQLTPEQLLRKDCKILRIPEISIAIPAIPVLAQQLLEMPHMLEAMRTYVRANNCTAMVVQCYNINEGTDEIRKEIIVFSDSIHKAKQVSTALESSDLQLRSLRTSIETHSVYLVYQQENIGLSRKYILPFLVTHFEGKGSNQNQLDVDASVGVDVLMGNGESSPNKLLASPLPSISIPSAQSFLGVGDPISQSGSSQNSAYNSCPYTPQNSCSEPVDGYGSVEHYFLPSFNSREMIEKIELKRGKLRGYEKSEDELKPTTYPFTPKNSYVESNLEAVFEQSHSRSEKQHPTQSGGVLHAIDSDLLLRKLMEKRRGESMGGASYYSSTSSSKSQSLTKLNMEEYLTPGSDLGSSHQSPNPLGSPNQSHTPPVSGAIDIPHHK